MAYFGFFDASGNPAASVSADLRTVDESEWVKRVVKSIRTLTTVATQAASGQPVVVVAGTTGIVTGTQLSIGGESVVVASVEGTTVTLTENLSATHAVGTVVSLDYEIGSYGDTVISLAGTSSTRWQMAPDNAGSAGTPEAYGDPLTISATIGESVGVAFWVRAKKVEGEPPSNDTSATISADGTAVAV